MRPPAGFISAFYDPLNNPNAPTAVTASGGDTSASVAFTAPSNVGGSAITGYGTISTPGDITATAASSPISVTGLTNGTAYTFAVWAINSYGPSAFSVASGSVTPAAPRGLFGGGAITGGTPINVVQYITITTTGDATDFGDLTQSRYTLTSCSSSTRGLFGGGIAGAASNVIDYVTISSAGNATDFGDLTTIKSSPAACASATRGIFAGGNDGVSRTNVINYVTIASTGNATDYGDLLVAVTNFSGCGSSTRGIFSGGYNTSSVEINVIQYITIASTGNAVDFGDLLGVLVGMGACSNSTRALIAGGEPPTSNVIQYVTIATTGNAIDFGDLTVARYDTANTGASSSTRGVFAGGNPSYKNVIDYVTIATLGNATDFGDLISPTSWLAGCSNAHGGLS
jgi:hypothetical protein